MQTDKITETLNEVAELKEKLYNYYSPQNDSSTENGKEKRDELREEIATKMGNIGFSERKYGTYRTVFIGSEYVIKLAESELGRKENAKEIRNNTRINNREINDIFGDETVDGCKYIADVEDYEPVRYRWLIMERVTVTPNNVSDETANKVKSVLADAGVHINEIHPANMGMKGKYPVIFDYAGT
jgi:hypothetical protein